MLESQTRQTATVPQGSLRAMDMYTPETVRLQHLDPHTQCSAIWGLGLKAVGLRLQVQERSLALKCSEDLGCSGCLWVDQYLESGRGRSQPGWYTRTFPTSKKPSDTPSRCYIKLQAAPEYLGTFLLGIRIWDILYCNHVRPIT